MTDTINNQEILRKLVEREVIMNASTLVDDLVEAGKLDWYDDIENLTLFICKECNNTDNRVIGNNSGVRVCNLCDHEEEQENWEEDTQEIYEWWFVNKFLFDDLKGRGEPVIDSPYGYLWGRTTTGQAIAMDSVIEQIASDMEILQGQKYDWSK